MDLSDADKERFSQGFQKTSYCWVWTRGFTGDGYPAFSVDGQTRGAHRVAYAIEHGEVPAGLSVLHRCDNPACVNPDHLFAGTNVTNMKDMIQKGRSPRGERNSKAKLTESQVKEIRRRWASGAECQRRLAEEFGIGYVAANRLIQRITWKHVQ